MKILFNNFPKITYNQLKPRLSFCGFDKSNLNSDTFTKTNNKINYTNYTSNFYKQFPKAFVDNTDVYCVEDVVDTLLKGFAKEKIVNAHFRSIFHKMDMAPPALGYSDFYDPNYIQEITKKIENSKLMELVNCTDLLPVFDNKVPNIGLYGKLDLIDKFIYRLEENVEDLDVATCANDVKILLYQIYTSYPKQVKKCGEKKTLKEAFFKISENVKHRAIIDKEGQLISLTGIKNDTLKVSNHSKKTIHFNREGDFQYKYVYEKVPCPNYILNSKGTTVSEKFKCYALGKHIISSINQKNPAYRYNTLLNKMGIDINDLFKIQEMGVCAESTKQKLKYEKEIEQNLAKFFDKKMSWLPIFKNNSRPNITMHSVLRLLERFILDTRNIDSLSKKETKKEVKDILTTIYTKKPMRILIKEDNKYECLFKHKDYVMSATFSNSGRLLSIYKFENDLQ